MLHLIIFITIIVVAVFYVTHKTTQAILKKVRLKEKRRVLNLVCQYQESTWATKERASDALRSVYINIANDMVPNKYRDKVDKDMVLRS